MFHQVVLSTALIAALLSCEPAACADEPAGPRSAVSLTPPDDGGTPRDPKRIEDRGNNEFFIRASVEEGKGFLTHAVSRLDLLCRNPTDQPVTVQLSMELSEEGARTNFDQKESDGMPRRDFLFIQPSGGEWTQVDGTSKDWTSTVRFEAPPGDTRVGLSPWYTYADYLAFIQSLPETHELTKTRIGRSDHGREHWEVIITDPNVPANAKKVIFWHAREHAYETFSSFAMEGLIPYLLSPTAAAYRKIYTFVLHPMTNVDGVAEGYEYRGGYDYPKPRGTETGRLTFETIDRVKPAVAVAWHNWIAPRDADVLFYTGTDTGTESGSATRRAWDVFTQHFISPRAAGHHWLNETIPVKYNWQGRELHEGNVHQYAMKKLGTQVWGWEMPWWGRTAVDARRCGASYARALLATLDALHTPANPVPEIPTAQVPRWEVHEFRATGKRRVDNPFRDTAFVGEFTSPSGKTTVAEGFYDGSETWRVRFSPDELGEWTVLLRGEGFEYHAQGKLTCTAAASRGFVRFSTANPFAFESSDSSPFFPMGDMCYGLFDDTPITPALRAEYLTTRRSQRFNFVRLTVGHSMLHSARDPENYWAWGGTPDRPDFDRFNPRFFQNFDELMRQMRDVGMNAELILCNFYRSPFRDPKVWTRERERQWLRYVLSRYADDRNVFLWTVANEYELHSEGKYRLDDPGDPLWAIHTARLAKSFDPYHHPVTVHPVVSTSRRQGNPKAGYDPPWRIGEFFGESDAIDVLSQQTGLWGEGTKWDDSQSCWTGDSPDVGLSIEADRHYHRPVMNTENGYEFTRGGPTEKKQVHHTDKVRRTAWRIVAAGGYVAAGFNGTIGHSDAWNTLDAPNHYTFRVHDEGAAKQLGMLYDCVTSLPFARLQPFKGVTGELSEALAAPGEAYLVYLPHGGRGQLDLTAEKGADFSARWLNPRTGEWRNAAQVHSGKPYPFQSPDSLDWTLVLQNQKSIARAVQ